VGEIRVVIADDDDDVRAALHDVLDADNRFVVVGTAATSDALFHLASSEQPDVVLVDVRMPGGGITAASAMSALREPPIIIAVSASTEPSTVIAMLRAGATGYLAKGRLGHWLPEMVARCADGQVMLAVPQAAGVLRALTASPDPQTRPNGLSRT
jgi:two-component system nitrate/nitrite response regulator NarL